ncbi:hypothetical protein PENTCL1PPCAC_20479 [Pristionchus entomophagus]|uniref:C-type lectin domain-containing protein n=1 Tax=Pristionchus entomophagus TaxID=358040 RepID=A0AAV5TWF7_9BILA|nr:hypothetical protein PENTCL1PPCAC_20479 [Pristionchus entomophagus]
MRRGSITTAFGKKAIVVQRRLAGYVELKQKEKKFYTKLAVDAGANGTIYIGAQYSEGALGFTDGSYYLGGWWANGFPNTLFGNCMQMLLTSEFGNQGQWTNIDCSVKQPFMCFRDGTVYVPPTAPSHPKADAKCPPIQYYSLMGSVSS